MHRDDEPPTRAPRWSCPRRQRGCERAVAADGAWCADQLVALPDRRPGGRAQRCAGGAVHGFFYDCFFFVRDVGHRRRGVVASNMSLRRTCVAVLRRVSAISDARRMRARIARARGVRLAAVPSRAQHARQLGTGHDTFVPHPPLERRPHAVQNDVVVRIRQVVTGGVRVRDEGGAAAHSHNAFRVQDTAYRLRVAATRVEGVPVLRQRPVARVAADGDHGSGQARPPPRSEPNLTHGFFSRRPANAALPMGDPCCSCWRGHRSRWHCAQACVRTLQRVAGADACADQVHECLVAYLVSDPPSDAELTRLARLHRRHGGSHGIEDYACTTLYGCALQVRRTGGLPAPSGASQVRHPRGPAAAGP